MNCQFFMFLAADNAATQGLVQATLRTPPAYPSRANVSGPVPALLRLKSIKFMAAVLGNTIGLAMIMASCWFCLSLLRGFL
jgi:hypothetical protein